MFEIFLERFRQKHRTVSYPSRLPVLLPRFRGRPFIDAALCSSHCGACAGACATVCPSGAIQHDSSGSPALDMGLCTFCGACAAACPGGALVFTTDWRLAASDREALIIRPLAYEAPPEAAPEGSVVSALSEMPVDTCAGGPGAHPQAKRRFLLPELPVKTVTAAKGAFAKSFRLRQVTAAGCGACEADLNVLATVVFDIGRFGMDFVASPRHADAVVLTGPVPRNMSGAFALCLEAMAEPKVLVAVGACAISGGLFNTATRPPGQGDCEQKAEGVMPHKTPHLFIPGCPPHPYTSLDGLLRLSGVLPEK